MRRCQINWQVSAINLSDCVDKCENIWYNISIIKNTSNMTLEG